MLAFLPLLFNSGAFGAAFIEFKNNATLANGDLKGRLASLIETSNGAWYESISYDVSKGQASGDGVFGAAFAPVGKPLTTYLAYFSESAAWSTGASTPADISLSAAGSFIGAAYRGLIEVDSNGNHLMGIRFANLTWAISNPGTSGPVQYLSFTGTTSGSGWANFEISFTFAVSSTPVYLSNGALITPKSISTTINILGFPFASNTSTLNLVILLATASGSLTGNVQTSGLVRSIVAGSGNTAVYFDGSTQAYVDGSGTTKSVTFVTQGAAAVDFDGADFLGQLDLLKLNATNLQYDLKMVNISLPNSDNITYDPTSAAGDLPQAGTSGASTLKVQVPLFVFAIIAILFANY